MEGNQRERGKVVGLRTERMRALCGLRSSGLQKGNKGLQEYQHGDVCVRAGRLI